MISVFKIVVTGPNSMLDSQPVDLLYHLLPRLPCSFPTDAWIVVI